MKIRTICYDRWEILFEFFSLRFFETFIYHFVSWFTWQVEWWTRCERRGWELQPFPFLSSWPWLFFQFLLQRFSLSLCSTLYFFSFLLNCLVSLAYLVRKSLDFLIPSLLAHHMSYLQFYRFLSDLITEFTKTFTSYWSVCRESTSFKLCDIIYCIEYIFLNNISCCKNSTVPLCGQSRKKGWRIGLQAGQASEAWKTQY